MLYGDAKILIFIIFFYVWITKMEGLLFKIKSIKSQFQAIIISNAKPEYLIRELNKQKKVILVTFNFIWSKSSQ